MERFEGMKVLTMDDEEDIRNLIKTYLQDLGVKIFEAANSMEALSIINSEDIDLALLDIRVPVISGIEVLKEITKNHPQVVCIIVTGYGDKENIMQAIRHHAYDFLEKPFDRAILYNRVKNALLFKYNRNLLVTVVKEYLIQYFDIKKPDAFIDLNIEEQNKILESAIELIMLKEAERAEEPNGKK